ncbi:serine/threonine protein kinase [Limnobacter sp.]|uniref:serine/threonine protein kinase n=1 Tax=Limnobacter sp. TaxID=2003368 RepID=UPI002FE27707
MNDNTVIQSAPATDIEANQQPLSVGTVIEGFEIRGVIGVGGFGIVYQAWDFMLERLVALKEYLPASLAVRMPNGQVQVRDKRHSGTFDAGMKSFINEARLLAQFDHAALVKVYRFWEMAGTAYMVMPLYQGITLKAYVEQSTQPLQEDQLLHWLEALTQALEVMHQQQCYHRDISPENIIIQEGTGLPILLDFGAARRAIGTVSQPFTVILKASYAPIEQYAEVPSMTQGPWTDVYALAAVAHFLITGKTPPSSVARMVNDAYTPLANRNDLPFNMPIRLAIDHALAVQPQDRTASMARFRHNLLKPAIDVLDLFDAPQETQAPAVEKTNTQLKAKPNKALKKTMLLSMSTLASIALIGAMVYWAMLPTVEPVLQAIEVPANNQAEYTSSAEETPVQDNAVEPAFQAVLNQASDTLGIQMEQTVLRIGHDLLQFSVRSPINGYVAVYVRSSDNTLLQLLPNARIPTLTIVAGQTMQLPPANEPMQAAGPAGQNQFLVVVTEKPRSYAHLKLQDHYGFGLIGDSTLLDPATQAGLEGSSQCANPPCQDALAAAWFSVEEVD